MGINRIVVTDGKITPKNQVRPGATPRNSAARSGRH